MVIVQGVPFHEIIETARTQQVDLIVMGTHGHTGFQHVLWGSVAEKVVRLAPCPILVARQPTIVPIS
jgi:nucleotide-binding universal stress UspA family protein